MCACGPAIINVSGPTTDESSYVIGSFKSDSLSASNDITASLHDIKHQLLMQRSNLIIEPPPSKLMNGSSLVSPGMNGGEKPVLMTRRELTDPFGSDEDEEKVDAMSRNKSPPKELMSPPPAIDNVSWKILCLKKVKFLIFFCFLENCEPSQTAE